MYYVITTWNVNETNTNLFPGLNNRGLRNTPDTAEIPQPLRLYLEGASGDLCGDYINVSAARDVYTYLSTL